DGLCSWSCWQRPFSLRHLPPNPSAPLRHSNHHSTLGYVSYAPLQPNTRTFCSKSPPQHPGSLVPEASPTVYYLWFLPKPPVNSLRYMPRYYPYSPWALALSSNHSHNKLTTNSPAGRYRLV